MTGVLPTSNHFKGQWDETHQFRDCQNGWKKHKICCLQGDSLHIQRYKWVERKETEKDILCKEQAKDSLMVINIIQSL